MSDTDPSLRWAWAKSDYLAGIPVGNILKAYTLPRTSFYRRARREGWLRIDDHQEAAAAGDLAPAPPPQVLERTAMDEAARAVLDGDLGAAEGWLRVVKRLRDLALQDTERGPWLGLLKAMEQAADVPAGRNSVEQVETPETQAAKGISPPEWNSSTDLPGPGVSLETEMAAITALANQYRRQIEGLLKDP